MLFLPLFLLPACKNRTVEEPSSARRPSGSKYTEDGRRVITMGTWYNRYYMSKHRAIEDDPKMAYPETARLRLERIRYIEEKYNVVFNSVNLTFNGVQESIETSIPEGTPDADIYEVDLQFGIPAVLKNYAVSLEEMGLKETDVLTDQRIMKHLALTGQREKFLFSPSVSGGTSAYVLAFNLDMIRRAGLPNPQDLWDRGEWTWGRWREYLRLLTKDTAGADGPRIYGFSGYWTDLLTNLLFSNDAGIARSAREELSDPKTLEVLTFIYDIYNTDKSARPWDPSNWEINNRLYAEGLSGFWIGADWIFDEQGGKDLPFEIGVAPWPVGPHGNRESNRQSRSQNNWYFIPRGVENPRLVYDIFFDWVNWFDGNRELSEEHWSKNQYMNDRNYAYAVMMASRPGFDIWDSLGTDFNLLPLISGEVVPEEMVKEYALQYQAALDTFFK
ncbi:MAG: extracellular solute-binding protein [Treponema sp.]|nr:extracellular solute-binding protein [Treponema sp.]